MRRRSWTATARWVGGWLAGWVRGCDWWVREGMRLVGGSTTRWQWEPLTPPRTHCALSLASQVALLASEFADFADEEYASPAESVDFVADYATEDTYSEDF